MVARSWWSSASARWRSASFWAMRGLALGLLGLALALRGDLAVLGGDRLAAVPELALPLLEFSLALHARQQNEQGDAG